MAGFRSKRLMGLSRMGDEVQSYDYFWEKAKVELKFSFWPRRCYETKKRIFGHAYRARRVLTGPGDPVIEDRWLSCDEYLWGVLSGKYVRNN